MSVVVTPSLADVYASVRAFLLALVVPSGTQVVRGQDNRVPQPRGDHVVMQLIRQSLLSTNTHEYDSVANTLSVRAHVQLRLQLDFYGPLSGDQSRAASALLRDPVGATLLAPACQPLHADEASQSPLITGEQQYLSRWTVDAFLQWNPLLTVPQEFADSLNLILINIDERFPP